MDRSEIPYDTCHQGVPSGVSKLISKHMVCSMQTTHLPCIRISTISKLTEPSFHLSLFTQEYQIVHPKWFLRLWCIRHKPCTYLALKLTLFLNRPKWDSIWHTSSRSSIGCIQIDFQVYGMFHANRAPSTYLAWRLALSPNWPNQASTWASSSRSTNRCVKNGFLDYGALGTNYAPILHRN